MIKNSVTVYIDGINRTAHMVMPLKFGNYLDERLDECTLALRNIKKAEFAPLTPVEIALKNVKYWGIKTKTLECTEEETLYYVISNDSATENLIGKGVFNNDLNLMEVTKVAECVVCDTLTVTNDLGRTFALTDDLAEPVWE